MNRNKKTAVFCSIWCILVAEVWALPHLPNDPAAPAYTFDRSNADDVLTVASKNNATKFAELVKKTSWLAFTLMNTTGKLTLFAFSDSAYNTSSAEVKAALAQPWSMETILQYHVALGANLEADIAIHGVDILLTSLFPSPPLSSATPLQPLHIDAYWVYTSDGLNSVVTASGAPIVHANLPASNGVVHIIDKVIYPVPTGACVAKYIEDEPKYSRLFAALEKVNLTRTLSTPDFKPLTILAPSDSAFKKLTPAQIKLLENTTILTQVLTYHVVVGSYYKASVYEDFMLVSLEGSAIYFERGAGGISAEGQMLTEFDATVTNGVVHELDGVMFPRSLRAVFSEE